LQHEVKDFTTWKAAFDQDESNRAKAGLKLISLNTSLNNPNDVTAIFEAPNTEAIDAMMSNPDFQETMKNAGVTSAPSIKMAHKV
jgi:hypothetical protein